MGAGGEVLAGVPLRGEARPALCWAQPIPPQDGHVCAAPHTNVLKEGQNAAEAAKSERK